jgi:hypothetical protein
MTIHVQKAIPRSDMCRVASFIFNENKRQNMILLVSLRLLINATLRSKTSNRDKHVTCVSPCIFASTERQQRPIHESCKFARLRRFTKRRQIQMRCLGRPANLIMNRYRKFERMRHMCVGSEETCELLLCRRSKKRTRTRKSKMRTQCVCVSASFLARAFIRNECSTTDRYLFIRSFEIRACNLHVLDLFLPLRQYA